MAVFINDECINCGACTSVCPNNAIAEGDSKHVVNPDLCTECVGFHDDKQCMTVCPSDAIHPDPNHVETKEQLMAKKVKIHGK